MGELRVACECGTVQGELRGVTPSNVNRGVCYCLDCQAFARHLGRDADVLDEFGGTEVTMCSPDQLVIKQGKEHIACLRFGEKGLMRWYASCCRSPLANSMPQPWVPFVSLISPCLRPATKFSDADAADSGQPVGGAEERKRGVEAAIGPPTSRIYPQFANASEEQKQKLKAMGVSPFMLSIALLRLFGRGFIGRKHRFSPLFRDGRPIVEPTILGEDEVAAAKRLPGD